MTYKSTLALHLPLPVKHLSPNIWKSLTLEVRLSAIPTTPSSAVLQLASSSNQVTPHSRPPQSQLKCWHWCIIIGISISWHLIGRGQIDYPRQFGITPNTEAMKCDACGLTNSMPCSVPPTAKLSVYDRDRCSQTTVFWSVAVLRASHIRTTLWSNKNLAIANRSRVSCAHNMLRASIGINITPWPWNLG